MKEGPIAIDVEESAKEDRTTELAELKHDLAEAEFTVLAWWILVFISLCFSGLFFYLYKYDDGVEGDFKICFLLLFLVQLAASLACILIGFMEAYDLRKKKRDILTVTDADPAEEAEAIEEFNLRDCHKKQRMEAIKLTACYSYGILTMSILALYCLCEMKSRKDESISVEVGLFTSLATGFFCLFMLFSQIFSNCCVKTN